MRGIHSESKREHYDVVIIGAGIAGLSVATLLAKAGRQVLLVERHDRPGGYAHGFQRNRFHFDAGVHLVSSCGASGYDGGRVIHRICRAAGIDTDKLFLAVPRYARALFPGLEAVFHSGEEALVESLSSHFPAEKDGLVTLLRVCKVLAQEAMQAEEILELGKASRLPPSQVLSNVFRYRRATLAEALDQHLTDPHCKSVCAALWPYMGLPPDKLSFLYWAAMMAGYTYEGSYYCRGSFQRYADQLAAAIERLDGEVLLNASVRRIVVEQGRAAGILLENGQVIRAPIVISNADARQTVEWLLGREHLPPAYLHAHDQLAPSLSIFASYIATDLPLADDRHCHEAFFFDSFDHDAAFKLTEAGQPNWFSATLPTLSDASLAPADHHIMLLTTLCPYDIGQSWRQAKPAFEASLLRQAERHFPELGRHLIHIESGSPRTLERYTLNRQGAAYGFAPTPAQTGPNRPSVISPLPGLYHAGHWTRPGGGVAGVSISALLAAQAVLGIPNQQDFWNRLAVRD